MGFSVNAFSSCAMATVPQAFFDTSDCGAVELYVCNGNFAKVAALCHTECLSREQSNYYEKPWHKREPRCHYLESWHREPDIIIISIIYLFILSAFAPTYLSYTLAVSNICNMMLLGV